MNTAWIHMENHEKSHDQVNIQGDSGKVAGNFCSACTGASGRFVHSETHPSPYLMICFRVAFCGFSDLPIWVSTRSCTPAPCDPFIAFQHGAPIPRGRRPAECCGVSLFPGYDHHGGRGGEGSRVIAAEGGDLVPWLLEGVQHPYPEIEGVAIHREPVLGPQPGCGQIR